MVSLLEANPARRTNVCGHKEHSWECSLALVRSVSAAKARGINPDRIMDKVLEELELLV